MREAEQYPPGITVAAYLKSSSTMQHMRIPDDQIREARELTQRHGWSLDFIYEDEAMSARSVKGRAAYLQMLVDAEARRFSVIVVEDVARLSRHAAELYRAFQVFEDAGVAVWTLRGGRLQGLELAIRAQLAEEEMRRIGSRISRGIRAAKETKAEA